MAVWAEFEPSFFGLIRVAERGGGGERVVCPKRAVYSIKLPKCTDGNYVFSYEIMHLVVDTVRFRYNYMLMFSGV
jgi:hypothetical protein